MNEGNVMHIEVEKPKINPIHFTAIVGGIVVNVFLLGGGYVSLKRDFADMVERQQRSDTAIVVESKKREDTLSSMSVQIGQIQPLQFQMSRLLEQSTENKTSIIETNKRVDRVVESFGGKLDTVIENVNKVATQVQVLSSKIDGRSKPDQTQFRTPVVRP